MLILDQVGLDHFTCGSGWVGSRKLDPRPSLCYLEVVGQEPVIPVKQLAKSRNRYFISLKVTCLLWNIHYIPMQYFKTDVLTCHCANLMVCSYNETRVSLLVAWHSGRTSVSDRRTFAVLRSTCG